MNKHFRFSGSTFRKMEELGIRASEVLRRAGLSQNSFAEASRAADHGRIICAVAGGRRSQPRIRRSVSCSAQRLKTERFNPVSLAALSTENLGPSVEKMARYKQLTCPKKFAGEELATSGASSSAGCWRTGSSLRYWWNVLCVGAFGGSSRYRDTALSAARGVRTASRAHGSLEQHFGCPMICGAPRNVIVFRATDANGRSLPVMPSSCRCWRRSSRRVEAGETATRTSWSASAGRYNKS